MTVRTLQQPRGWASSRVAVVIEPVLLATTRCDRVGGTRIPASGGCAVAMNHLSQGDPHAVGADAVATGCPVLPVGQWGVRRLVRPCSRTPRLCPPTTIHQRVGEPVDLTDLRHRPRTPEVVQTATDRIVAAIVEQVELIRGERAPVVRFDPRAGQHRDRHRDVG